MSKVDRRKCHLYKMFHLPALGSKASIGEAEIELQLRKSALRGIWTGISSFCATYFNLKDNGLKP